MYLLQSYVTAQFGSFNCCNSQVKEEQDAPEADYLGTVFSQNSYAAHLVAQSWRYLSVAMTSLFP